MRPKLPSIVLLCLGGCATVPSDPLIWVRTDGQKITGNLALEQQIKIDETVCDGQTQQSASNMQPIYTNGSLGDAFSAGMITAQRRQTLTEIGKGCMAGKGYVLVPTSQADAQRLEFAKTAKLRPKAG